MALIPNEYVDNSNFDENELQRLLARFMKLDKDSSGQIDKSEFLAIPAIASNPLAQRLIEVFDADGDGVIDFGEFIRALSVFSSRGRQREKLRFAFNIYDIDRDGYLSNGELFIVLKAMVGNNLAEESLQQVVDKTIIKSDKDGDGKLSFEEFLDIVDGTTIAKSLTLDKF